MNNENNLPIEAEQWGLPTAEIPQLGERFYQFAERYRPAMRTKTHDTSQYGVAYLSDLLRLQETRTITAISREQQVPMQNMGVVHFA